MLSKEQLNDILEKHKRLLLSCADGTRADLTRADLRDADLRDADLTGANLTRADLRDADLTRADLTRADLIGANLSRVKGLLNTIEFMEAHFDRTSEGWIVYKDFGYYNAPPAEWKIEAGSIINENVNACRSNDCGCGINVAPINWIINDHNPRKVWKCLIKFEWACGIVVPYNTDGKIRCERVRLLEEIEV